MASHHLPIASLVAVAVLAAGCSGNDDDGVAPSATDDTPPASSIAVTTDVTTSPPGPTTLAPATNPNTNQTTTTERAVTTTGSPSDEVPTGADDPRVVFAIDDTSDHFGYPRDEISVASIEAVTWPTTALGCPATGVTYAEVEVPGYRITLSWADVTIVYHGALDGTLPFRCEFLD